MGLDYPETRRDDTAETLHGQRIEDPYRWLEDPDSDETRAWVKTQNELSRAHLDGLASRPWFEDLLTAYVSRPRAGTPDKVGGRYVVTRNDGTREQDLVYVADSLDELRAGGRLLLDPNTFSDDGTSSLFDRSASKDHELLAYLVSDGGGRPYKVHFRAPGFAILSGVPRMIEGKMLADLIPTFDTINMIGGEVEQ